MRLNNSKKLKLKIIELFNNQEKFAKSMGMTKVGLSQRLNGRTEWKLSEVYHACNLLEIPYSSIYEYFFCPESSDFKA